MRAAGKRSDRRCAPRCTAAVFSAPATRNAMVAARFDRRIGQRDARSRRGQPVTAATQCFRSSSTGWPGMSEAVCPSLPRPSSMISKSGRAGSSCRRRHSSVSAAFRSARRVVGRAVDRHRVILLRRHRHMRQHRFLRHAVVAGRAVVRKRSARLPRRSRAVPMPCACGMALSRAPVERLSASSRRRARYGTIPEQRRRCRPTIPPHARQGMRHLSATSMRPLIRVVMLSDRAPGAAVARESSSAAFGPGLPAA